MITVSMIVKNEQDHLEACLESVKDADEIVVVDTGSDTDETVKIAKGYTDNVHYSRYYEWKDDFAHSRNQSLDLCPKNSWILIIDADEVLKTDMAKIRKKLKYADDLGKDAVYIKAYSESHPDEWNKSIRLFKNTGNIKWKGKAHNYLVGVKNSVELLSIELSYGYSNAHLLDPDRTLRILQKAVDEDPSLARERFYLAREHYYRKNYDEAIREYEEYIKISSYISEKAEAYLQIAKCYWYSNRGGQARDACAMAIRTNPDFKEAMILMGDMHYEPWKSKWKKLAEHADNSDVLFVR